MANYRAIAAVGQAIVNLLKDASRVEFPQAKFKLFQASDFTDGNELPTPEGATIYLYRVGNNAARRSLPPRRDSDGKRYRPSLPLDLFFLVTIWAGDAEKQYRLLGWVMRVLEDTPILPAALLNDLEQNGDIFDGNVELFLDPITLADMSVLWENLKQVRVLPSITYVARMVLIDSFTELPVGEPAQTRDVVIQETP
jgi:hypothetical protein